MNDFFKMVRTFLIDYLPKQRNYSKNTVKSYRETINIFVAYLREVKGLKISEINFDILEKATVLEFLDWLQEKRNCSESSRNQRLSALRSFFEYASENDCTVISLSAEVKKDIKSAKQQGRLVKFLSEPALKALLAQPDAKKRIELRNMVFMTIMYDTAARCSEILELRLRDLSLNTEHPDIYLLGKGRKPRPAPLLFKTTLHIERYLKEFHPNPSHDGSDLLFYTVIHGRRNPMSADTVALFMRKYGEMARKDCPEVPERVRPHMLRHSRAMHYYRDGMPLVMLAEYLGHNDVETTRVYAFADTEMKRKAMTKADPTQRNTPDVKGIWEDDEEMILYLSGLKI